MDGWMDGGMDGRRANSLREAVAGDQLLPLGISPSQHPQQSIFTICLYFQPMQQKPNSCDGFLSTAIAPEVL